jgi:hypothetical protein
MCSGALDVFQETNRWRGCYHQRFADGVTDGVNDAALVALGLSGHLLRSLILEYNQHVTDAGLVAFARNGALTTLWVERISI